MFRIISGKQPILSPVSSYSLHLAFSVCIAVNLKLICVIPYGQYVTITPKKDYSVVLCTLACTMNLREVLLIVFSYITCKY